MHRLHRQSYICKVSSTITHRNSSSSTITTASRKYHRSTTVYSSKSSRTCCPASLMLILQGHDLPTPLLLLNSTMHH
jgi:hypothetical protein